MRFVLQASAIVVSAGCLFSAAAPARPTALSKPSDVWRLQDSYLRAGKYRQLWGLFTPRFHASCNYSKFLAEAKQQRAETKGLRLVLLSERIVGNRGYLKYHYLQGSKVVVTIANDLYVRIGGRWLDEVDRVTSC